jgi:hypothetical protein
MTLRLVRALARPIVRRIDNILRPRGIMIKSYLLSEHSHSSIGSRDERGRTFDQIFESNFWGSPESASGPGSETAAASGYRDRLASLLQAQRINSIFDAPCGDLNWIRPLIAGLDLAYVGGDISPALIAATRAKYPALDLRVFDICEDEFPEAGLWHCRDCLFHLPFVEVRKALANFASSKIELALITTNKSKLLKNRDVETGGFRELDLERPPFMLPPARAYLKDFDERRDFPRYVGLWSRRDIEKSL